MTYHYCPIKDAQVVISGKRCDKCGLPILPTLRDYVEVRGRYERESNARAEMASAYHADVAADRSEWL